MRGKGWVWWAVASGLAALCVLAACVSGPKQGSSGSERTSTVAEQLSSAPNLQLQVETAACPANQAFDFFQVTNAGTTSVPASQVTIKMWVDDTTGQNIVSQINSGGCLTNANGCFHQVSGVSIAASHFSSACGPDPAHQADWEITISTADTTPIGPGVTWANIQPAVHLANFANFSPGTADWYSPCLGGNAFQFDTHFAVYVQGNLVTASPGVPPSCKAATGTTLLSGEVPPGLGTTFPLVGPLPGATTLNLGIGLPLNAQPAGLPSLSSLVQQVSDPTNASYRQFVSPATFASRYGANANDYASLQSFVTLNGMTVTGTHPTRSLLSVTGTAAAIESAFFVTLNVYKRPDGTTFYAPADQPSLNLTLNNPIVHVSGFDDFAVPIPSGVGSSSETCPWAGSGSVASQTGIFGADVRTQYLSGAGGTACVNSGTAADFGGGQTIGLLELDTYSRQDVESYASGFVAGPSSSAINFPAGFSNLNQFVVPNTGGLIGFATAPGFASGNNEAEVALDLEMVLAMAPQANVVVYEWNLSKGNVNYDEVLQEMADPLSASIPPSEVLANSWTWTASLSDATMQQIFVQFAAQGQSFFQAAGDLGAYGSTYVGQKVGIYDANGVPDPIAESSLMTVVGGTQFVGAGSQEQVWNDDTERSKSQFCKSSPINASVEGDCASAGGGGFLAQLPIPLYQTAYLTTMQALSLPVSSSSSEPITTSTTRMIPDVSMVANSLATVTGGAVTATGTVSPGGPTCSAGTSAATVLWASYVAVGNASRPATSAGAPLSGTVGVTNGSTSIKFSTSQTLFGETLLQFASQPGVTYQLASPITASTGGTLVTAYSGTTNVSTAATLSIPATAGFANPTLYALAASNTSPFNDIQAGNNAFTSGTTYAAVPNYDVASGLGSPKGCGLVASLPQQVCQPGTSVTAVVNTTGGPTVTAVFPRGSYNESGTGVDVVQVEAAPVGSAAAALVPPFELTTTSDVLNTCAGDSTTQNVLCVSNGTSAYVFNVPSVLSASQKAGFANTLTGNSTLFSSFAGGASPGQESFSGGNCSTCNATIDPVRHVAYMSVATAADTGSNGTALTGAAIQPVNLTTNPPTLLAPIPVLQQATSEDILVDPVRGYLLSPNEGNDFPGSPLESSSAGAGLGDFQIVNTFTGVVYDNLLGQTGVTGTAPTAGVLDSAAEDCATGVAVSTIEAAVSVATPGAASILLVDLTGATFTAPATFGANGTWSAPGKYITVGLPQSIGAGPGGRESSTAGTAVVEPGGHLAVVTSEFGGSQFAVVQLPSAPGTLATSTPTVVTATMPNTPDSTNGNPIEWAFGDDPHEITAYNSPINGHSYAIFEDDVDGNGTRTFLAVVDLTAVLTAANPNSLSSCSAVDPTTGASPTGASTTGECVVRFIGGLQ